jgi:hypothetical protein
MDRDDPVAITIGGASVTVGKLLAFGDISNLYRCTNEKRSGVSVFKITRSHHANQHLARETEMLRRLLDGDDGRFSPFLPHTFGASNVVQSPGEAPRLATVLQYNEEIGGPDDLYSLQEVRAAYPNGIDARDMAWMWRRLLTILGYVHQQGFAHGLVTPDHVLIEPSGHKLVLISWCGAVSFGSQPSLVPFRWREWINPKDRMSSSTDLACAGRSMLFLLNSSIEPAISRHLLRAGTVSDAWKLLEDFDRLIEALWGPRQFREFRMSRA